MKKMLWVGDCGCPSGFARATHEILATLHKEYDVTVLGINYRGDPLGFPEFLRGRIWAAAVGGWGDTDVIGSGRLIWMCDLVRPDVIVLQNDGWNIPAYMQRLRARRPNGEYVFPEHAAIPVVAVVAVDGRNFQGGWLAGISHAVFWTQFALDEARAGGYGGPATVIPLGVDLGIYRPQNRAAARSRRMLPEMLNGFIVGNVNRNQPRKRWDLTIKYFAEWVRGKDIRDAFLYMQPAPTGDAGYDVRQLAVYYGVADRLAMATSDMFYGVDEHEMAEIYNCLDVIVSTTQGEGFGLPALEAMACGVPCILPDWSAYGSWARSGALLVSCPTTNIGPPYVNVVGGVPDEAEFINTLDAMYWSIKKDKEAGEVGAINQVALACAQQPCFRWAAIGQEYLAMLEELFYPTIGAQPVEAVAAR